MLTGGTFVLINILKDKDNIIAEKNVNIENNNISDKEVNNNIDYELLNVFSNGFAIVKKDGKYGYIDVNGNVVLNFEYDHAEDFIGKVCRVKKDGKYYTLYDNGNEIKQLDYEIIDLEYPTHRDTVFKDGMAVVRKDGKYGYIDENMKIVIDFQYDEAYEFSEGLARVKKDNKEYFIDKTEKIVIDMNGTKPLAKTFSDGLLPTYYKEKHFFINKSGKIVSKSYDDVYDCSDGMAMVKNGDKYGFVDNTGKLVIDLIYEFGTGYFQNGYAVAIKNKKYGLIDKTGEVIIDFKYDYLSQSTNALYYATKDEKKIYIDKNENVYTSVVGCDNGWTKCSKDGKAGFLDEKGDIAIKFELDYAGTFHDGITCARKDGKFGVIDLKGQFKAAEQEIEDCWSTQSEDAFCVKIGGKWGFIDAKTAKLIIEPQFDSYSNFYDQRALVKKNGKLAFINKEGQVVIGNLDD